MTRGRAAAAAVLAGLLAALDGCGGANTPPPTPPPASGAAAEGDPGAAPGGGATPGAGVGTAAAVPAELAGGERLFDANCARCHGPRATGTGQGPPLVDVVYEPNHHGDAAFQRAVALGTPAHHWRFGDMPPVPGVTPEQVAEITAYVRWLQRQAGIG